MDKSYFKIFFSKIKERKWLDEMGDEGYLLTKIKDSKYYFSHSDERKYKYSIEFLDMPPQSQKAEEYYIELEKSGIKPILTSGNWVYFVKSNGNIVHTANVYKKNGNFYLWRSIYLLFFAVFGAIVCGYQAYASKFLPYMGHTSDGKLALLEIKDSESVLIEMLNIVKNWANKLFEILNNGYLGIFRNIFGDTDAAVAFGLILPIVIVLTVLFALNLDQYLEYRSLIPNKRTIKDIFAKKRFGRKK